MSHEFSNLSRAVEPTSRKITFWTWSTQHEKERGWRLRSIERGWLSVNQLRLCIFWSVCVWERKWQPTSTKWQRENDNPLRLRLFCEMCVWVSESMHVIGSSGDSSWQSPFLVTRLCARGLFVQSTIHCGFRVVTVYEEEEAAMFTTHLQNITCVHVKPYVYIILLNIVLIQYFKYSRTPRSVNLKILRKVRMCKWTHTRDIKIDFNSPLNGIT